MNWKLILLAGMVLALSPFQVKIGQYTFLYSVLGCGLALFAFLFKKNSALDLTMVVTLTLGLLAGLFNLFPLYMVLQVFFIILVMLAVFLKTRNALIEKASMAALLLASCYFIIVLFNALGIVLFLWALDVLFYAFYAAAVALWILDFRNDDTAGEKQ